MRGSIVFSDVNECNTPANNCKFQCKNLIGRFMCICPPGYLQVQGSDDCIDIDECSADPSLCSNGRCYNLEGSYRCECFEGFEPTPDRKRCVGEGHWFSFSLINLYYPHPFNIGSR